LADTSAEIASLNSGVVNLPTSTKYGSITYAGADLGVVWQFSAVYYHIFDTPYNIAYQLSSQAEDQLLGVGNDGSNYPGDGIVPVVSQTFNDLPGFPGA